MEPLRTQPLGLRRGRALLLILAALWFGALAWWHRFVVIDDPWITFRYAHNLLQGHGLAFNPGEPLEGYSNFLWMLLSAVPIALGVEPLGAMRALSVLCVLVTMAILSRARLGDVRPQDSSPFAPLLLAACYPVAVWAMGGLETSMHALLVLLFALTAGRLLNEPTPQAAGATAATLVLLALSRPEGAMFAAVLLPAALRARQPDTRRLLRFALGAFAAALLLYTAWRWMQFGTIVPNTVSAKTGGNIFATAWTGLRYCLGYFLGSPFLLLAFAAAGAYRARRAAILHEPRDPALTVALLCALLQLAFAVAVGGDWMPGFRFLVPALPLLVLLASHGIAPWPRFVQGVAVAFLLFAGVVEARRGPGGGGAFPLRTARWLCDGKLLVQPLIDVGTDLRAIGRPTDTVAMSEAGVVPYHSQLRLIDMLGIVDANIAKRPGGLHEKTDPEYVLAQKPRFIILGVTKTADGERGTWLPDAQLLRMESFRGAYREIRRWHRWMSSGRDRTEGAMILYERNDATEGTR